MSNYDGETLSSEQLLDYRGLSIPSDICLSTALQHGGVIEAEVVNLKIKCFIQVLLVFTWMITPGNHYKASSKIISISF